MAVMAVSSSADPGLSRKVLDRRSSKEVSIGGRGVLGVRGVPGTTFGVAGTGGAVGVFGSSAGALAVCSSDGGPGGFVSTVSLAICGAGWFVGIDCAAAWAPDFCVAGDVVDALRLPAKARNACSTDDFVDDFVSSAGTLDSCGSDGVSLDGSG